MPIASDTLYLASASPRRRELLAQIGIEPVLLSCQVDEAPFPGEAAEAYVCRLARAKAETGWAQLDAAADALVLGADTAVVSAETLLGKPMDRDDALRMLGALSGRRHQVMTAVAVCGAAGTDQLLSVTEVAMREITPAEMDWYWDSGEPCDKAGAYGIQGLGAIFVSDIKGSYSGVVGLPLYETAGLLASRGYNRISA